MNFLKISDFNEQQIKEIFILTDFLKHHSRKYLKGKLFILFFPETSIRTRITFERGIKALGGECIMFPPDTLDKKEALEDVIGYISNYATGVIVRHKDYTKLEELAKHTKIPIINAMTNLNHPCEILSDLYSISKLKANYIELVYTFVGEEGNISRSWMEAAKVLNLSFNHVCIDGCQIMEDDSNYHFNTNLEEVLKISDVVLTDSLSNSLKSEQYINQYQITLEKMKLAKENAILNPCPPFYRGEEVSSDAISSNYFVGYEFKKNLVYVQQAIILYCLGMFTL